MPLQAQQIVAQATQIARVPGYLTQAGELLNSILTELAQTYDLAVAAKASTLTLTTGQGSGPYILPLDYLRVEQNEVYYLVEGIPQVMVNIDLSEYHALSQQNGISNYPLNFATDTSNYAITTFGAPVMYVWPPSGGVFLVNLRYYSLPADINTPETSTVIPWFPNQTYLIRRLSGELMALAGDARMPATLGNAPDGAQGILDRYLKLQDDDEGRAKTVHLDRRRFGTAYNRLPDTKIQW